jgi:hypothetical protein
VLLHMMTGSKEDVETVTACFEDMKRRGWNDPLLVTSDGAPGIIKWENHHSTYRTLSDSGVSSVAVKRLGGTVGRFAWPRRAVSPKGPSSRTGLVEAKYKISSRNGPGVKPMQILSVWVRQVAVGALSVFVFPLAVDFFKRMAENVGIYDQPGEAAGTVLNFLLSLSQQSWLRVTALTLGAFVAGLLLERRLQKLDRSRIEERKDLGFEMIKLGNQLRGYTGHLQGEYMTRARQKIVSCFTTARKLGIWAPSDRIFSVHPPRAMDLIADYLMDVGTMLIDGHFSEAKQHAKSRKAAFTSVYAK